MRLKVLLLILLVFFPLTSRADPFISSVLQIASQIKDYQMQMADIQSTISRLNSQIQEAVSGQSEWGNRQFNDFNSWGLNVDRWNSLLNSAVNGDSNSQLGAVLRLLSQEFPLAVELYNRVNPNKSDQKFYSLKAKTALVARAASQLSYDKIQEQINYTNQLRQQIGTTSTLKEAVDLSSRLTIENNLIQIEVLRQLALMNQQHAIDAQAQVNDELENARFVDVMR